MQDDIVEHGAFKSSKDADGVVTLSKVWHELFAIGPLPTLWRLQKAFLACQRRPNEVYIRSFPVTFNETKLPKHQLVYKIADDVRSMCSLSSFLRRADPATVRARARAVVAGLAIELAVQARLLTEHNSHIRFKPEHAVVYERRDGGGFGVRFAPDLEDVDLLPFDEEPEPAYVAALGELLAGMLGPTEAEQHRELLNDMTRTPPEARPDLERVAERLREDQRLWPRR